jgi:hypothetical protein
LLVLRYFMPPFDMEAVCPRRSEMGIWPILIHRVDSTTTTRGRTVTHDTDTRRVRNWDV